MKNVKNYNCISEATSMSNLKIIYTIYKSANMGYQLLEKTSLIKTKPVW